MSNSQEQQQQQQQKKEDDDQQNQKKQKQQQQQKEDQTEQEPMSARSPRRPSRYNKIYRTPPTPDADVMFEKESKFILDSRAVSSISQDYSRANPKLGSALPPYNSQKDGSVKPYFDFPGVQDTLEKNKQTPPGTSIEGPVYDRFYVSGHGFKYLTRRNNCAPNAYSNEERMGHGKLWRHPNPPKEVYDRPPLDFQGYNGRFGYRRTNPALREDPSPFGVNTDSPIY